MQKANSEPRRLSAVGGRAPTRKHFAYFFCNFPVVIFLEMVKGVLVGRAVALAAVGLNPVSLVVKITDLQYNT